MELRMLNTLGFNFSRPLPLHFLRRNSNATLATTWTPTLAHYSTYSSKELLPVVCRLALALTKRDDSKLKAVHTKYVNKKFMKVGELADLQGEVVQKLARKQLASL